jgi:hypothetical protein
MYKTKRINVKPVTEAGGMAVTKMIIVIMKYGFKDVDLTCSDQIELFVLQGVTVMLINSGLLLN